PHREVREDEPDIDEGKAPGRDAIREREHRLPLGGCAVSEDRPAAAATSAHIAMAEPPDRYGRAPQAPYGHRNGSARRPPATRGRERRRGARAGAPSPAAAGGESRAGDHPPGRPVAARGGAHRA